MNKRLWPSASLMLKPCLAVAALDGLARGLRLSTQWGLSSEKFQQQLIARFWLLAPPPA